MLTINGKSLIINGRSIDVVGRVTKIVEFEAAHFLPGYDGACSNLHGHSYKAEITIRSATSEEYQKVLEGSDISPSGMLMDFSDLKALVKADVMDLYDHANLNEHFRMPTAEVMACHIAYSLQKRLCEMPFSTKKDKEQSHPFCEAYSCPYLVENVRLWETSTSFVDSMLVLKPTSGV